MYVLLNDAPPNPYVKIKKFKVENFLGMPPKNTEYIYSYNIVS